MIRVVLAYTAEVEETDVTEEAADVMVKEEVLAVEEALVVVALALELELTTGATSDSIEIRGV